jgi:hypothetical protein
MDGSILLKSTITAPATRRSGHRRPGGVDCSVARLPAPRVPARCGGARVPPVSLLGGPEIKTPFLREER